MLTTAIFMAMRLLVAQILTFHLHPVAATRDAHNVTTAERLTALPQTCAHTYFPPERYIMTPAVGGPASDAKAQIVATMPNRMPSFRGSLVRLARAPTNVPWLAPFANPKKTLKTYMPVLSLTPIQANSMQPRHVVVMMKVLMGPRCLSAMYPTIGRAGISSPIVMRRS